MKNWISVSKNWRWTLDTSFSVVSIAPMICFGPWDAHAIEPQALRQRNEALNSKRTSCRVGVGVRIPNL